jgi:hypothetical protein
MRGADAVRYGLKGLIIIYYQGCKYQLSKDARKQ